MGGYALAIDIGASSGRLILGHIVDGKIILQEIDRFSNDMVQRNRHSCWDMEALLTNICRGLAKCAMLGTRPKTLGIDTWGVDYSLISTDGQCLYPAITYRDPRTESMPECLDQWVSAELLYSRTGIARQSYNTIYQLMAELSEHPELHQNGGKLLFTPCYLSYRLTGIAQNEYSIASTSGLLNAVSRTWDTEVLQAAGIPVQLLGASPVAPGTLLGLLRPELTDVLGASCNVILPASHDTASAYLAVSTDEENAATISSGTWSLLGMELDAPLLTTEARQAGFTNEGGYGGKYTVLRNIMGLWILQSIRREWNERYTFAQMAEMASRGARFSAVFNAAHERFLAPQSMVAEIITALREAGSLPPSDDEELLYCVHHSLAICYRDAVQNLAAFTGKPIQTLHIVGGGCQNRTLNQLTADATGLRVLAGPLEATALGNIIAQWIAAGDISSVAEARTLIKSSFNPEEFLPRSNNV